MRSFQRVAIIANPTSGAGRAGRLLRQAVEVFRDAGLTVASAVTEAAGEAKAMAADLCDERTLIVAAGGDGTFNEILNGADLDRCVLSLIPAGTGNVLAKELGLAHNAVRVAHQILNGRVVRYDVGLCNGRRFACMAGAGLDAHVVRIIHRRRGRALRQWQYAPEVARAVLCRPEWGIRAEIEGYCFASGLSQVVVGNAHSYGGPIELTPAASPHDGLLDAVCLRLHGALPTTNALCCAALRRLHIAESVPYGRGARVRLTAEAEDVPVQVDGDPAGRLPATIELLPGAARLAVPASYRPAGPRWIF